MPRDQLHEGYLPSLRSEMSAPAGRWAEGWPMQDIDAIIAGARALVPGITTEQLKVRHPGADDDGLWLFGHPASSVEVQLESPNGMCPFLFESGSDAKRQTATTIQEAIKMVVDGLRARLT